MPDDHIPLVQLPRELAAQFTGAPKYSALYTKIVNGELPASRDGGRWIIRRADLPAIARALGLKRAPSALSA